MAIKNRCHIKGFTLIELMLVVAIIGILAAIAIPKFADMVIKAKEAAVKGKLGSLRSAISIYYSDNEGNFPNMLGGQMWLALTANGRYIDAPISISIPGYHAGEYSAQLPVGWCVGGGVDNPPLGVWCYDSGPGLVTINCTHTDTKGSVWSRW